MPERGNGAPARRFPAAKAGVGADIRALPSIELRSLALRLLVEIEAGVITGKPLDDLSHVGDRCGERKPRL